VLDVALLWPFDGESVGDFGWYLCEVCLIFFAFGLLLCV
jgi:hypothetical protein